MKHGKIWLVAAAFAMVPSAATAAPVSVAAAVAAPGRTADNVKLDESRKPAEVLAFMGLEQGDHVLDLFGGNRYWAEIMAAAVGPYGSVVVWEPTQFMSDKTRTEFADFAKRHANASLISSPFENPVIGTNAYDFAMLNLNYHDVYWESPKYKIVRMEPQAWLKRLYAAMKPGATVGIVDHVAKPGSFPRASVEAMHRIDPAVVRADFKRAGFRLVAESDMLRNPADDHMVGVFDEKIRGRTDRFVMKFRKPMR